jgi:hypothetical protein
MNLQDEIDKAGPVVDRLNAAIRDNPLAAGLIGAGVAWMLFGGVKGFGVMAGVAKGAAVKSGSAIAAAGNTVASGMAKAGSTVAAGVQNVASDVAGSVASIVPDLSMPDTDNAFEAVAEARSSVGHGISSAAAAGREYGAAIQSRLSKGLEQQPLLLGAIGVAIGATIASTFATTRVEGELMGEQGTAMREKLQSLSDTVKDRAQQVVSEVKNEAAKQGLTPDAAKGAATEIGEKVKAVAGAGRESAAQSFALKLNSNPQARQPNGRN